MTPTPDEILDRATTAASADIWEKLWETTQRENIALRGRFRQQRCGMASNKSSGGAQKTPEEKGVVDVLFDGKAREFKFFNLYELSIRQGFISLLLVFQDPDAGQVEPVFKGMVLAADLKQSVKSFKDYVARLGGPPSKPFAVRGLRQIPPAPTSFNTMGFASHGPLGEVAIQQFSHKIVAEVAKKGDRKEVDGVTHGIYTSPIHVHLQLVYDLINLIEAKK
jgi:hypothetical protein